MDFIGSYLDIPLTGCKRKEEIPPVVEHLSSPKKPRLVFTDLQRRTLQAIFKVNSFNRRPLKITIVLHKSE